MNFKNNLFSLILFITSILIIKNNLLINNYAISKTKINKINKHLLIKNNLLSIQINQNNNNIENINLLKYKDKKYYPNTFKFIKIKEYFKLILNFNKIKNNKNKYFKKYYIPLINIKKIFIKNKKFKKTILISNYISNKIKYKKYIILKDNSYKINIKYKITNNSQNIILLHFINKIKQQKNEKTNTYNKMSFFTKNKKYEEYQPEDLKTNNFNLKTTSGWTSISEQYFLTSIIPTNNNNIKYFNLFNKYNYYNKSFNIGYKTNNITIKPNETKIINYKIWIGPKISDKLNTISPNLNNNIHYGILWFISKPLFTLIKTINHKIHNLGWSLIIITIIIKIITYPLNRIQYISILEIKRIQLKIKKIKKKYKHNKYKTNTKIINLYQKYKVHPLNNLFITIIQIPIFISIFNIINTTIEFKNSSFIFWIQDLSESDPYYLLPISMGLSMFFTQYSNSEFDSKKNKQLEIITSIIFTILSLWFSSGLIIHYIINNLITIGQQKMIEYQQKENEK